MNLTKSFNNYFCAAIAVCCGVVVASHAQAQTIYSISAGAAFGDNGANAGMMPATFSDNMDGTFTLANGEDSGSNNSVFLESSDEGSVSAILGRALTADDVVTVSGTVASATVNYSANGVEFGLQSAPGFRAQPNLLLQIDADDDRGGLAPSFGTPLLSFTSVSYRAQASVSSSNNPDNFDLETFEASFSGSEPFNITADVAIPGGTAQADLNALLTSTTLRADGTSQFSVGGDVNGSAGLRWEFLFTLEEPALLQVTGSGAADTPPVGGGLGFFIEKRFSSQPLASAGSRNSLNYGAIWGGPRELEAGRYCATFFGSSNSQRQSSILIQPSGFANINALLHFTPLGTPPEGDREQIPGVTEESLNDGYSFVATYTETDITYTLSDIVTINEMGTEPVEANTITYSLSDAVAADPSLQGTLDDYTANYSTLVGDSFAYLSVQKTGNGNATIISSFEIAVSSAQDCLLGDVNESGDVDFSDISPFISLLSGGGFQCEADINVDGMVDFSDIAPFIGILAGG